MNIEFIPSNNDGIPPLDINCPICNSGLMIDFQMASEYVDSVRRIMEAKEDILSRHSRMSKEPLKEEELEAIASSAKNFLTAKKKLHELRDKK